MAGFAGGIGCDRNPVFHARLRMRYGEEACVAFANRSGAAE